MVEDSPVARLAVISDTHLPRGGRALPAACLEQLRGADAILHAGDLMELLGARRAGGDRAAGACRARQRRLGRAAGAAAAHTDRAGRGRRGSRWSTTAGRRTGGSLACGGASRRPTPWCSATRTCRCTRSAAASRSSTPARRPSAGARPTTRWASPPCTDGSVAFELARARLTNGERGPAVVQRGPAPVRVGGGDLPPTRNLC